MARMHIMSGDGGNPVTSMSVGNAAGQISTAEANDVANGSVVEVQFQFDDDPTWNDATRTAQITLIATDAVARTIAELQTRLKYFGRVIA